MNHSGRRIGALLLTLAVGAGLTACGDTDRPAVSAAPSESGAVSAPAYRTDIPVTFSLTDAEGQPLGGVTVTVQAEDDLLSATASDSGQWTWDALPIRQFLPLTVSKDDTPLAQAYLFLDFGGQVCYYSNSGGYLYVYLSEAADTLTAELQVGEDGTLTAVGVR